MSNRRDVLEVGQNLVERAKLDSERVGRRRAGVVQHHREVVVHVGAHRVDELALAARPAHVDVNRAEQPRGDLALARHDVAARELLGHLSAGARNEMRREAKPEVHFVAARDDLGGAEIAEVSRRRRDEREQDGEQERERRQSRAQRAVREPSNERERARAAARTARCARRARVSRHGACAEAVKPRAARARAWRRDSRSRSCVALFRGSC